MPRLSPELVFADPAHRFQRQPDKWRGGCPRHESKSGSSFTVNPETLRWHCAGCQIGGGPLQYRHWLRTGSVTVRASEFVSELQALAVIAGVELPQQEMSPEEQERRAKWERRRGMLEVVQRVTQEALWSDAGTKSRAYLAERGFNEEAVRNLGMGLFRDLADVVAALRTAGYHEADAREAGLISPRLLGYIIIPWADERGQPLTLYGRFWRQKPALMAKHPGWQQQRERAWHEHSTAAAPGAWVEPTVPKTIALPGRQTKAAPLYFDRARRAGHRQLILVEGVLDAALLHALGDTRVIACVAAQLSKEQAACLARYGVTQVVICLDPDSAGERGILSCIKSLEQVGITAYVAPQLPNGQDPDEFVLSEGIDAWREHVAQATHAYRYRAQQIILQHRGERWTDTSLEHTLRAAVVFAQEHADPTQQDALERFFWSEIREGTGTDRSTLTQQLAKQGLVPDTSPAELFAAIAATEDQAERENLIRALARSLENDPLALDFWGDRLKTTGLIGGKTAFLKLAAELKRAGKAEKRAERTRSLVEQREARASESDLPQIDAENLNLRDVSPQALQSMLAANDGARGPFLYRSGNLPRRMVNSDDGQFVLEDLTEDRMRYILARCADWYATRSADGCHYQQAALPPLHVVKDLLAHEELPFPVITRLVQSPVFGRNGEVLTEPGYHPSSRTYYGPAPGFKIRPVSPKPTRDEVDRCVSLLRNDLLVDFPFVSRAEFAHTVALFLLPFIREMIQGPTPLHLIEKPMPGTGASLMIEMLIYVFSGGSIEMMTAPNDEDEWRKKITAALTDGAPAIIVIDNVRWRLDSAQLAAALTMDTWSDRILSTSRIARAPIRCAWVATGNNPALSKEIARRCVRVRLDAKQERPEDRQGFKHTNLRQWVAEHRGELVWCALTICQAWIAAGCPLSTAPILGSYEHWCGVMGGILQVAGIPGFLENLSEFRAASDTESATLGAFVGGWWEMFGENQVTVKQLYDNLLADGELDLPLGSGGEHGRRIRLGNTVKEITDRMFTLEGEREVRVQSAGIDHKVLKYRLIERGSMAWYLSGGDKGGHASDQPHDPPANGGLEGGHGNQTPLRNDVDYRTDDPVTDYEGGLGGSFDYIPAQRETEKNNGHEDDDPFVFSDQTVGPYDQPQTPLDPPTDYGDIPGYEDLFPPPRPHEGEGPPPKHWH